MRDSDHPRPVHPGERCSALHHGEHPQPGHPGERCWALRQGGHRGIVEPGGKLWPGWRGHLRGRRPGGASPAAVVLALVALIAGACSQAHRAASAPTSTAPPPGVHEAPAGAAPSASSAPPASTSPAGASWWTFGHDSARSGLDPTSPRASFLRPGWESPPLDGAVYAQPLVVGSSVIVATEGDSIYSFDAATGALQWSRSLGTPVPGSRLPCGDINPSGITGTPVADVGAGLLFVVAFVSPGHHRLFALDLETGTVRFSLPADPPGADPLAEQQRGALALEQGRVYIPYGGLYGDCSDYHGWVVGLPATGSGAPVSFEVPTAREGGIWAPPGPVVSSSGSIYVATGNGSPVDAVDDSDSVLELSPGLQVLGSFTPSNYAQLSSGDFDLGSTSPALLPGGLVFQVGKQGVGYLLGASSFGGIGGQLASAQVCGGAIGGDAVVGDLVVVSCYSGLVAVRVSASPPGLSVAWTARGARPGPPIVAGDLAWAVGSGGELAGYSLGSGKVAYRATVTVVSSFPTLAAADGELYVAGGGRLRTFSF